MLNYVCMAGWLAVCILMSPHIGCASYNEVSIHTRTAFEPCTAGGASITASSYDSVMLCHSSTAPARQVLCIMWATHFAITSRNEGLLAVNPRKQWLATHDCTGCTPCNESAASSSWVARCIKSPAWLIWPKLSQLRPNQPAGKLHPHFCI